MSEVHRVGYCNMGDETQLQFLLQTLHRSGCRTLLHELLPPLLTARFFCLAQPNHGAMFKRRTAYSPQPLFLHLLDWDIVHTVLGLSSTFAFFPFHSKLAEKYAHTTELESAPRFYGAYVS